MACTQLTDQQVIDLRGTFEIFDKNSDGVINYTEVKDMIVSLGLEPRERNIKRVLKEVDTDGDGSINFPEFLNLMAVMKLNQGPEQKSELEEMFEIFDRDNDKFITHAEMKRALDEMVESGPDVTHLEVDGMIQEADSDNDGKLSYDEFAAMMKKTHPGVFD